MSYFWRLPPMRGAEVVKGWVRLEATPSNSEIVEEYAKTDAPSLEHAAIQIMKRLGKSGVKRISIPDGAEVEIQTLPDFRVVGRGKVDKEGHFSVSITGKDSLWRAYCKVSREELGRIVYYVGSSRTFRRRNVPYYEADITLSRSYASAEGRCVKKDGTPIAGVNVFVHPITHGETDEETQMCPMQLAVTDSDGKWHVDGLALPSIDILLPHICDTNIVHGNLEFMHSPLELGIYARQKPFGRYDAELIIPNITDENRQAAEKAITVSERKSGKRRSRPNPLTNFPVSTNNVIYVPNLVLP